MEARRPEDWLAGREILSADLRSMRAIAFLGGGRITGALCAGLRLADYRHLLVVYERNAAKIRGLRREFGVVAARDLESLLAEAQIVVVAVRPGSVAELLTGVAECGRYPTLWVSLAAGVPLKNLRKWLPGVRWVRAMPSPVCRLGRGLTALCFDPRVGTKDRESVRQLFTRVGQVVEVPEKKFDAFTATYSSSHGYHALASLASAAQEVGLDRKTSLMAAAHALADGILYWRESGLDLGELLHEAATPSGIAAATMMAMDRAGYGRAVQKGLKAGIAQARRNAAGRQK